MYDRLARQHSCHWQGSRLLICLDELVNLYKLANVQARNSNYEQLLRILNDSLQGTAVGLGFVLGGTPDFLMDTRRGLYSYPALQSRLAENTFAKQQGLVDFTGPVLRLAGLTPEDFFVLLNKLRDVYAKGEPEKYLLPDEALPAFMEHCQKLSAKLFSYAAYDHHRIHQFAAVPTKPWRVVAIARQSRLKSFPVR